MTDASRPDRAVLIVEDDVAIRCALRDILAGAGFRVHEEETVVAGTQSARRLAIELLLLDLVLPDGEGLQVLEAVRPLRPTLPVIVLTAKGDVTDRVALLRAGADDYVVKPFSAEELLARVDAVLRRSPARPVGCRTLRLAGGVVDFERHEFRPRTGSVITLTDRELELLRYLGAHRGRVVSREELMENVWRTNPAMAGRTRTMDMVVSRLREKLGDDAEAPEIIRTVHRQGYVLTDGKGL